MSGFTFIKSPKSQPKRNNMNGVKFVKAQKNPSQRRTTFFFSRGGENCSIALSHEFICNNEIEELVHYMYSMADAKMPKNRRK